MKTSRRVAVLRTAEGELIEAVSSTKAIELTVGDDVFFERRKDDWVITRIRDARNHLERTYFGRVRKVAANLDLLVVVTATGDLFNTECIDRALAAASYSSIPSALIVNKIDLGLGSEERMADYYRDAGIRQFRTSAKFGQGMEELRTALADPKLERIAFVGMSGVGKSRLLNSLIPDALRKTGDVSEKTGQGKQTTSQAAGYLYAREGAPLLVIDCPGIQRFGLSHLPKEAVGHCFPEIAAIQPRCQFSDCTHTVEPNCAVRDALREGRIAQSRFDTYSAIRQEILENDPYSK